MMPTQPSAFILYTVFPQIDWFAGDGLVRALGGFANAAQEAEECAESTFQSYVNAVGEADPADFVETSRDQGIAHLKLVLGMRQAILNLMAAGLFHLYEQHTSQFKRLVRANGNKVPDFAVAPEATKIRELELVANTVKHAHGDSAKDLRKIRPDLFVAPIFRNSPLAKHILARPIVLENPLGGSDLFVTEADIGAYRDALRAVWESVIPFA